MLDLDSLAEKRATAVNESSDEWLSAVWSPLFQKLSQNMSDGEIEFLLSACPSSAHLDKVLGYLRGEDTQTQPLSALQSAADTAGLDLQAWIRLLR